MGNGSKLGKKLKKEAPKGEVREPQYAVGLGEDWEGEPKLRHVSLDGLDQAALIVLVPSGVAYKTQVGGTWCRQEIAEGVLVPFENEPPLNAPELALHAQLRKLLWELVGLTNKEANAVDHLLSKHRFTMGARVDRARMAESTEAWVYVDLRETDHSLFRGFGNCKAVLTWPNSN